MTAGRDRMLIGIAAGLIATGFLALSSASLGLLNDTAAPAEVLTRQFLVAFTVGVLGLVAVERVPMLWLQRGAFWIFAATFLATLAVFIPDIGFRSGGAARWISVGPLFFQPSEFLKISFLLYLAAWIASRGREMRSFELGVLPFIAVLGALASALIFQPDIGTLGVMLVVGVLLFYVGGGRLRHVGMLGGLLTLMLAVVIAVKPYAVDRILVFWDSSFDPQGAGYHIRQAAIAFGSGGVWGKGFGESTQKFSYLPEPTGDAIFAVIGEEFGFLGTTALIVMFLTLLWRTAFMARSVRNPFARLLGFGVGILITVQALVNMGALAGLVPLTGITLPFISHGGSSFITTLVGVGLLLNVSKLR